MHFLILIMLSYLSMEFWNFLWLLNIIGYNRQILADSLW